MSSNSTKADPPRVALPESSKRPTNRRLLAAVGLAVAMISVAGIWTHHGAREGIDNLVEAGLQGLLNAKTTALKIWIENEKADVRTWANDADVRRLAAELSHTASRQAESGAILRLSPAQRSLQKTLTTAVADVDYRGFALIDPGGMILASDQAEKYVGRQVSPFMRPRLEKVFAGQPLFIRPLPKDALVEGGGTGGLPVILAAAPVVGPTGKTFAALVFTIDPEEDFSSILTAARTGQAIDTYAFDEQGLMLSESRYEEQLRLWGLLPPAPGDRSVLAVQIRDPGGDLSQGFKPKVPVARRPLTRMAASATAGQASIDLEGYRDYRGVKVIGAWRWLPEYDFGIATEVAFIEAKQALRPIRLAFWGLLGMVILLAAGAAIGSWMIQRLRRRIAAIIQLGQYTLVKKIGEGGMGKVYRARHALLRRPTAIKLIKGDQADAEAIARFEKEVQLTSELTHPNTISIYDYGRTPEGVFYYAMEYLPGINLDQLVQMEKCVPPARVVYILRQVCASLAEAHDRGLIHRDIKPQNIILCERGGIFDFVKVLDFGLVKEVSRGGRSDSAGPRPVYGSSDYIAPERLSKPDEVDARSDLYSVGAVGFFLLTGKTVFSGGTSQDICYQVVHTPPPRPSEGVDMILPAELDELIHGCLAKKTEERPQSAAELFEKLEAIDFASAWTPAEASRWWQGNIGRIQSLRRAGRPPSSSSEISDLTLDIDWGRRES